MSIVAFLAIGNLLILSLVEKEKRAPRPGGSLPLSEWTGRQVDGYAMEMSAYTGQRIRLVECGRKKPVRDSVTVGGPTGNR